MTNYQLLMFTLRPLDELRAGLAQGDISDFFRVHQNRLEIFYVEHNEDKPAGTDSSPQENYGGLKDWKWRLS